MDLQVKHKDANKVSLKRTEKIKNREPDRSLAEGQHKTASHRRFDHIDHAYIETSAAKPMKKDEEGRLVNIFQEE